ncbi:hypothetical protein OF83DRAFT_1177545 [Amylostereum chailletii]|nr:hypothetical protein OF83DRAFT_1177545 [Amylostereum chailletii]
MTSSSPSPNPLDVNFLAALIGGLNENNTKDARREGQPDKSEEALSRQAIILDSLANLSICNQKKQVVAIAVDINGAGAHLYVAENGTVDKRVVPILQDLISTLKTVKVLAQANPNIDLGRSPAQRSVWDHIFAINGEPEPAQLELTKLESRLVKHSWYKIKRRLQKRYDTFITFMEEVRGTSPDDLAWDQDDRDNFVALQSGAHQKRLDFIHSVVVAMQETFTEGPPTEGGGGVILALIQELHSEFKKLLDHEKKCLFPHPFFIACEAYLALRGKEQRLSMKRWLTKLVAVHVHFLLVVNLVGSITLAPFLDNVKISIVPPSTSDLEIKVDYERLQDVVRAGRWKRRPDPPKSSTEEEDPAVSLLPNDPLRVFLGELDQRLPRPPNTKQSTAAVPTSSPPDVVARTYKDSKVHCECSLIAYLHKRSITPIPYIGVSKLSCYLCNAYISAHSQSTSFPVTTLGCHSQVAASWICPPTASDDVKERLTKVILDKLARHLSKIDNELQEARLWARKASQSTVGSSDGENEKEASADHRSMLITSVATSAVC